MSSIQIIVTFFELVFYIYFASAAVYVVIFAFAGIFPLKQKTPCSLKYNKFAILIPGYKEDAVIVDVAKEALKQDYPGDKYDIVIIADSFQAPTLIELRRLPVKLVEVSFDVSTKSKALNKAMETIGDDYDVALILDADNVMETDFVLKINQAFNNGFHVVQGHRVAKNMNTSFAVLDAISEEVNNHIFRKGHRKLGFSSALIGSGMAFDYSFFKETMAGVKAVGKSDVFAKQRKRWLSAQFVYFGRYFFPGLYHLFFKGNIDFFDKVYQMVSPPRILLIGLTSIITFFYALVFFLFPENQLFTFSVKHWIVVFLLVIFAFLLSIPLRFYNKNTLIAVLTLPKAFALMFLSLFKLRGANKKFIHTEHGTSSNTKKL